MDRQMRQHYILQRTLAKLQFSHMTVRVFLGPWVMSRRYPCATLEDKSDVPSRLSVHSAYYGLFSRVATHPQPTIYALDA